jgi:hypothetical protein
VVKASASAIALRFLNHAALTFTCGDVSGPVLIRTDANAIARVTDANGNGIIIGPSMTVRLEAGKKFQVVNQGKRSFDSLGIRDITKKVGTAKCAIATQ